LFGKEKLSMKSVNYALATGPADPTRIAELR